MSLGLIFQNTSNGFGYIQTEALIMANNKVKQKHVEIVLFNYKRIKFRELIPVRQRLSPKA